jgi:hypothetical protein
MLWGMMVDNPDAAAHNEKHKNDMLEKQKAGKGHWKPELASDSEEAVRFPPVLLSYICRPVTHSCFPNLIRWADELRGYS